MPRSKQFVVFLSFLNFAIIHAFLPSTNPSFSSSTSVTLLLAAKGRKGGNKPGQSKQQPKKSAANNNNESKATKPSPNSKSPKKSTPPWQVLSTPDAKKNVEREKYRRELARQGIHKESLPEQEMSHKSLSTNFLSEPEQKFYSWRRFNPEKVPAGMRFVGSYLGNRLPPRLGVPEIAFLGRSNVGKSSLLNRLSALATRLNTEQARVGKTPGATASVNLYALMDVKQKDILGWVDLPGFGYAKLSKDIQESVQEAAERYLAKRKELALGILLVDIRRVPSDDDRAVLAALYDMGVPIVVVATKLDKISSNELDVNLEVIRDGLGLPPGQPLAVSSVSGTGTRDLWRIILEACEMSVAKFKQKFDGKTPEEEDDEEGDEPFLEDDEFAYDQGYDWVHGRATLDEDDDTGEVVDEESNNTVISPSQSSETLKELRKKARAMERRGEV